MPKKNKKKFPLFWITVATTMILTYLGGQYVHWLAVWAAGLITGALFKQKFLKTILSSFMGGFLMWMITILLKDLSNGHILLPKISDVFQLQHSSLYLIIIALIGGILALCGSWIGFNVRQYFTVKF